MKHATRKAGSFRACFLALNALLAALFILLGSSRASAYPWMIKHGYTACGTCHACSATGVCQEVGDGTADPACPSSAANCVVGGCNAFGACKAAPSGTACGGYSCAASITGSARDPNAVSPSCRSETILRTVKSLTSAP